MPINITKQVKLINPLKGETDLIYSVVNYNEVTKRCYIELVTDSFIKPQELVLISDIQNI